VVCKNDLESVYIHSNFDLKFKLISMKKIVFSVFNVLIFSAYFAQIGSFDASFNGGSYYQTINYYSSNQKIIAINNEKSFFNNTNGTYTQGPPYGSTSGVFSKITNSSTSTIASNIHFLTFNGDQYHEITDMDTTSDGKMAITGYMRLDFMTPNLRSFVGLINVSTGAVDANFNNGNYYTLQSSGFYNAQQLEVQSDDKIIIAGVESLNNFFIRRFNTDGTLDTDFGSSGFAGTTFFTVYGSSSQEIIDMKIMSDGKILVAGVDMENSIMKGFVARFNADGSIDNTFGINGIAPASYDENINNNLTSIAINSSNEIYVCGSVNLSGNRGFLFKLDADGNHDASFDLFTNSNPSIFYKVKLLSNNKILVSGTSFNSSISDGLFMLFNTDGTFDNTFGTNGAASFVYTGLGNGIWITDFDAQPDGKIIFTCNSSAPYQGATYIGRMSMSNSFSTIQENVTTNLSIYPNPANNVVTVNINQNTILTILNLQGKVLDQIAVSNGEQIDVSHLSSGVYFIKTSEGQQVKFIKE
jgi:uncharacterized delta-60 repeat protein